MSARFPYAGSTGHLAYSYLDTSIRYGKRESICHSDGTVQTRFRFLSIFRGSLDSDARSEVVAPAEGLCAQRDTLVTF